MKALAVLLYAMGNASFGMTARILDVSTVTVMRWIRDEAHALPEPSIPDETQLVMLDEMWHFIQKKTEKSGYGAPLIRSHAGLLPGYSVSVIMLPCRNY